MNAPVTAKQVKFIAPGDVVIADPDIGLTENVVVLDVDLIAYAVKGGAVYDVITINAAGVPGRIRAYGVVFLHIQ